jgi:hypothetical protein
MQNDPKIDLHFYEKKVEKHILRGSYSFCPKSTGFGKEIQIFSRKRRVVSGNFHQKSCLSQVFWVVATSYEWWIRSNLLRCPAKGAGYVLEEAFKLFTFDAGETFEQVNEIKLITDFPAGLLLTWL